MGKGLLNSIMAFILGAAFSFWCMVDGEYFRKGFGLTIPITIFGVLAIFYFICYLGFFINDNWEG